MARTAKQEAIPYDDEKNWARLIYIAKKHLDIWSQRNIKPYRGIMKLSYMPVIFNINLKGSTNTEISRKSLIAKQAMSRTIKELEQIGMIDAQPLVTDKRSYKINLSEEGRKFVTDANKDFLQLVEGYKKLVGEKEFNTTVEVLGKIIRYHENLHYKNGEEEE